MSYLVSLLVFILMLIVVFIEIQPIDLHCSVIIFTFYLNIFFLYIYPLTRRVRIKNIHGFYSLYVKSNTPSHFALMRVYSITMQFKSKRNPFEEITNYFHQDFSTELKSLCNHCIYWCATSQRDQSHLVVSNWQIQIKHPLLDHFVNNSRNYDKTLFRWQ